MKNIFKLSLGLLLSITLTTFIMAQDTTPTPEPEPTPAEVPTTDVDQPTPTKTDEITPTEVDEPSPEKMPMEEMDQDEPGYDAPLLGVAVFKKTTNELDLAFSGELEGLKAKAYIKPRKDGATEIKVRFDDMKMAPKDKRFVLWLVSPENEYTKLGQVINTGKRAESEIRSETAEKDFGLFVTVEETETAEPTGKVYSAFKVGAD